MVANKTLKYEKFRLKRMAFMAKAVGGVVGDVGFHQCPNPFLTGEEVVGIDPKSDDLELVSGYTKVYSGTLSGYIQEYGGCSFDVIMAGELIEHLEDPISFLDECFKALKPGGRLILSTPNPNSFIERLLTLMLSRRFFYTSEHVMLIPQRWLIRIMEMKGFVNVRLVSGGFPVPFFGLVPFPRPWCYQTIAVGEKPFESSN
ncbi:methyltransferase domain-containing protein [Marinobacter sp.]|uniref:methyltransferase domain-containing protein n=1 Tax=Marinobacter sp. TaxID=50741 RepID=UPI0035682DEF